MTLAFKMHTRHRGGGRIGEEREVVKRSKSRERKAENDRSFFNLHNVFHVLIFLIQQF